MSRSTCRPCASTLKGDIDRTGQHDGGRLRTDMANALISAVASARHAACLGIANQHGGGPSDMPGIAGMRDVD